METKVNKTVEITLVLTKKEARWLKEMVRYPMGIYEDEIDIIMRRKFWDTFNLGVCYKENNNGK